MITSKAMPGICIISLCMLISAMTTVYGQTAGQPPSPADTMRPDSAKTDDLEQGIADFQIGNYEEALDELTRARIQDPRSSVAAYYLGVTCKKMQQYDKALPNLMEALVLQPPAEQAYLELVDAYYVMGRYDEALKALAVPEQKDLKPARTAYLKGLVLMKKGKLTEALASFEKAKSLDRTQSSAVDFQTAAIYLRQGRQSEARELFLAVAAKDPESDTGQTAKQQAEVLSMRQQDGRRIQTSVGALYQYDSNVILKPDSAPTGTAISNQSDMAAILTLRAEYALPTLPAPYGLKFQYSLYKSVYQDLSAYDVLSHTLGIAPQYAVADGSASFPIAYNITNVDGKDYLQSIALTPAYVFMPAEGRQASVSFRYQQRNYKNLVMQPDENRNSTDVGAGIAWHWFLAEHKGFVNAAYEINKENTTGRNWSYLGNKFSAGSLYPITDALKLSLGLSAYVQDFAETHTAFIVKRKDTTVMLTTQALYGFRKNIDITLQFDYVKGSSNIPVYAYSKHVASMGLAARF